ncbi:MAG: hypothetical protein K2P12_01700, partial [Clostridia bacterium]|nr:hypothetical protein [Clostridia bacterium]
YKYGEENYLVVATDKGLKKFQNGNFEDSEIDTNFDKICNHYYRIFGAQANSTKLIFSDDFAPFNWNESYDEGGYINLPQEKGNITDLISFNQSLVVCQEDGFSKITAFSEQDEFTMKTISSPCNVKSGSVADCGDYIMFATTKGLGILDGYTTKTICEELAGYLKKCEVKGVAVDDYCYFLCKNKENSIADVFIIAYSLTHRNYHFINCHNANTIEACKFNSKDYLLIIEDKEIKFLSSNSNSDNKIWLSGSLDFGSPSEEKLLRKIEFGGKTIIDLRISADGKNYFFNISHQRSQLLNLKGRNFEIEIIPKGKNISVPSPILEYQLLEVE